MYLEVRFTNSLSPMSPLLSSLCLGLRFAASYLNMMYSEHARVTLFVTTAGAVSTPDFWHRESQSHVSSSVFPACWCTLSEAVTRCRSEPHGTTALSWQLNRELKDNSLCAALSTSTSAPNSPSFLRVTWWPMTKGLKLRQRHYWK